MVKPEHSLLFFYRWRDHYQTDSSACRENGFTLSGVHDSKGTYHPKDDPLVSSLTDIFNRLTGNQEQPYMMGGGTYARKLPNAVAFGLGMNLPGLAPCPLTKPGRGGAHPGG